MPPPDVASGGQAQRKAGKKSKGHRAPKKPRMSNEAWNTAFATFQSAVDNEASDDCIIRQAWTTLRQNYRERFNAKIVPQLGAHQNAQQNLEPFSIWAAENLDGNALERVLRVVFSKELADCDHLTLLRSTASLADTTMWHLILYFGVTVFSEHLLGHIRKRVRIFEKDPHNGAWAFTEAYARLLQKAAQRQRVVLDSTTISCPRAGRIFSKPDLTVLASANPEFDKPSKRRAAASTGSSHVRDEAAPANAATTTVVRNGTNANNTADAGASNSTSTAPKTVSLPEKREDPLPSGLTNVNVAPTPSVRVAPRSRCGSDSQHGFTPAVPPEGQPDPIMGGSTRRNPARKARAGQALVLPVLSPKLEDNGHVEAKKESLPRDEGHQSPIVGQRPRELSTIYVQSGSLQLVPSKRPVKEEAGEASTAKNDRVKRANNTASRSALLEENKDWDDDTILHVLEQLAATRPGEWTVIDGMRENTTNPLIQLKGKEGRNGFLLISLKLENGKRLLVVVNLKPSYNSKQGLIQYYDPAGPLSVESAAGYEPTTRLAALLSHVLPDRDHDRSEWGTEHCACPELLSNKDGGLAVCLAAVYAVGNYPPPKKWDWGFWRYLVLGGFFPDDGAVQYHVNHYREEIIRKLIRQGEMSDGFLTHQGADPSLDEIKYLGTAARNPVERIEWREENSKRIIKAIHEAFKVFQILQEHIDMGKASFKAQLDKHAHIQNDLRHNFKLGKMDAIPKVEQGEQSEESFNIATLQQATEDHALCQCYLKRLEDAGRCVRKTLYGLNTWRRVVNEAVAEDDKSLLVRSVE